MEESLRMILKSTAELNEDEIWKKPNEVSNSIGNIIVHLCGNITQYMLSGLGRKEDLRDRDSEFTLRRGYTRKELENKLIKLLEEVKQLLQGLREEELLRRYEVQGFDLSGFGIVLHVVEHLSYHTGQIAFWTKYIKNTDLGFYEGLDLNKKNKK
jgi:uncharacterized damage-inducible protein DinB